MNMEKTRKAISQGYDLGFTPEWADDVSAAFEEEASPELMRLARMFASLASKPSTKTPAPVYIKQALRCLDTDINDVFVALIEEVRGA